MAAAKKTRCDDFITALPDGYNTVIGEGGASLSGGEKQRISIARAMLKDAPIVILYGGHGQIVQLGIYAKFVGGRKAAARWKL